MAVPLDGTPIRALLLDIEGTTTPLDFVHRTLFPYAQRRLENFLQRHWEEREVRADIAALRNEREADAKRMLEPPNWPEGPPDAQLAYAVSYGRWLMERDSKTSPLKSLQGKIWQEGYRSGELHGEVYPDVPPAFARWSRQRRDICIFSSGSILAQKLLFSTTTSGDLTALIRAYHDTTTGPKGEPESYSKIAASLGLPPAAILFISDVVRELEAARSAGLETACCVRSQGAAPAESWQTVIHTFDEVFP